MTQTSDPHDSPSHDSPPLGVPAAAVPLRKLQSGPLSLLFDPSSGFVRFVRFGDVEVLRGIYAAVRDRDWNTLEPVIESCSIQQDDSGFSVTFQADCSNEEEHFRWAGEIRGQASGQLDYRFSGVAMTEVERNRIGFCVLHPTDCAGNSAVTLSPEGCCETVSFPSDISPHQPMMNLRQITHSPRSGMKVSVRMEGETFEMEDQRNWTDASFKTYCTPLEKPFPVRLSVGQSVEQSIHLSIQTDRSEWDTPPSPAVQTSQAVVEIFEQTPVSPVPQLGLGSASHRELLCGNELKLLNELNLSHLRCDLDLAGGEWVDDLTRAATEATSLGVPLEVALFVSEEAASELVVFSATAQSLIDAGTLDNIVRCLVFHRDEKTTSDRIMRLAHVHLRIFFPGVTFGGGTNAYFAELNREPPDADGLDFVCYSINPQVHAFDNLSLVETLEVQGQTVRSARSLMQGLPVVVSPVTLKPRFNPNATSDSENDSEDDETSDARQSTLFAAGWTLGSLKYLASESVSAVTYFETSGCRGVIDKAAVYPIYFVFQALADFRTGSIRPSRSSHPLAVESLVLESGLQRRILLANLSGDSQATIVRGVDGDWSMRSLDGENVAEAMHDGGACRSAEPWGQATAVRLETRERELKLELAPYAFAVLDRQGGDRD